MWSRLCQWHPRKTREDNNLGGFMMISDGICWIGKYACQCPVWTVKLRDKSIKQAAERWQLMSRGGKLKNKNRDMWKVARGRKSAWQCQRVSMVIMAPRWLLNLKLAWLTSSNVVCKAIANLGPGSWVKLGLHIAACWGAQVCRSGAGVRGGGKQSGLEKSFVSWEFLYSSHLGISH